MKQILTCKVTSSPIRLSASDAAEIVTQSNYGEKVVYLEKGDSDWIKVKCIWDDYIGWVDQKQYGEENSDRLYLLKDRIGLLSTDKGDVIVGVGANLTELEVMSQAFDTIDSRGVLSDVEESLLFNELVKIYHHTTYLWGGRSFSGIDCSGLVQVFYSFFGFKLPRDASQQCEVGNLVGFLSESRKGDIAFFENTNGKIVHVGIILDNHKILHAAGEVRIDELTEIGIFKKESGEITHHLRLIRRLKSK